MCTHVPVLFYGRNYLDTILDLPWSKSTNDQLGIAKAKECLDSDHYGIEKLKKRVLEYLAVRQLKNDLKGYQWIGDTLITPAIISMTSL